MRRHFSRLVEQAMTKDPNIIFLTGDLGYGLLDNIRNTHPDRFINVGSSEQLMLGMATGLALSGKIPIVYSISPFLIFRPYEIIRNYLQHENIPVKLVGSGRGLDYSHDGFSHWTSYEEDALKAFYNILKYYPSSIEEMEAAFHNFLYNPSPFYLNLKR